MDNYFLYSLECVKILKQLFGDLILSRLYKFSPGFVFPRRERLGPNHIICMETNKRKKLPFLKMIVPMLQ